MQHTDNYNVQHNEQNKPKQQQTIEVAWPQHLYTVAQVDNVIICTCSMSRLAIFMCIYIYIYIYLFIHISLLTEGTYCQQTVPSKLCHGHGTQLSGKLQDLFHPRDWSPSDTASSKQPALRLGGKGDLACCHKTGQKSPKQSTCHP